MNFFQNIESLLENVDVKLNISKVGETISVLVIPDPNQKIKGSVFAPIMVSGTAEELDQELINVIKQPLSSLNGIVFDLSIAEKEIEAKTADKKKKEAAKKEKDDAKKEKAKTEAATSLFDTTPDNPEPEVKDEPTPEVKPEPVKAVEPEPELPAMTDEICNKMIEFISNGQGAVVLSRMSAYKLTQAQQEKLNEALKSKNLI